MNFTELQVELQELLNFNPNQSDQDFTTAQLKRALNRAVKREYTLAKAEGSAVWFVSNQTVTWLSGVITFSLPESLRGKRLYRIFDITAVNPGFRLIFDNNMFTGDVFWLDRSTLQWGSTGPSEDKTLQVQFYSEPTAMVADEDEPGVIPESHHELLYWSAAVDLRTRADEQAPQAWYAMMRQLQLSYWKHVSMGRPSERGLSVENVNLAY